MNDEKRPEPKSKAIDRRKLDSIAGRIKGRIRRGKNDVYETGGDLCEAAKEHKYREEGFMKWFEENFGDEFTYQTAHNFMRVFLCCPGPEVVQYFPVTLLYNICQPTFPEKLRDFIFSDAEQFDTKTKVKELKATADKVKVLGFNPEKPEVKKLLKDRGRKEDKRDHIMKTGRDLNKLAPLVEELDSVLKWLPRLNGGPVLTKEQADMLVVKKLKKWGLMPEYGVFDEDGI